MHFSGKMKMRAKLSKAEQIEILNTEFRNLSVRQSYPSRADAKAEHQRLREAIAKGFIEFIGYFKGHAVWQGTYPIKEIDEIQGTKNP